MNKSEYIKAWEKALNETPLEFTPEEEREFEIMRFIEKINKKSSFTLGGPIPCLK